MVLKINVVLCFCVAFLFLGCADPERDNPYDPGASNSYNPGGSNSYELVYCQINYSAYYSAGCRQMYKDNCYNHGGYEVSSCSNPSSSSAGGYGYSSSSSRPSSSSVAPSSSSSSVFVSYPCDNTYTYTDGVQCGGQYYRTVKIGSQTWMAENLNYTVPGPSTGIGYSNASYANNNSACYNNSSSYCEDYGRLYDWATAMALPSSCNYNSCASQVQTTHRGICPSGWHIPSDADWDVLMTAVGGSSTAGKHLKAQSGWNNCSHSGSYYVCNDTYGFSALPGGIGYGTSFDDAGDNGYWWSSSEYDSNYAYGRYMSYGVDGARWLSYSKTRLFSVRCLKD